jgi:hypothetical protein
MPEGDPCGNTPGSLSFGQVMPGQSADRAIKVLASGSAQLTVLQASMEPGSSPAFSVDAVPPGTKLAPGSSFEVKAHYRPATGGTDSGAILIRTDAPGAAATLRVPVCGQGVAPAVCAHPVPLDLGAVATGMTGRGTLHITSCGLLPLDLSSVALSSDPAHPTDPAFSLPSPPMVPETLAPNASIDLEVDFLPPGLGSKSGFVEVDSDALGNTKAFFPIQATGAMPCGLNVVPDHLTYIGVASGQNASKQVLITNDGASSCSVSNIQIAMGAPAFSVMSPPALPLSVPAGGSVPLSIVYSPQGGNPDMGRLEVTESGNVHPVALVGNPPAPSGCTLEPDPSALNFGLVAVGSTRMLGLNVKNVSSSICFLQGETIDPSSSPGFSVPSALSVILPGMSATVQVSYRPMSAGSASGTLHLNSNDVTNPMLGVPLFASSVPAQICVDPQLLPFGAIAVGGAATMDFHIIACGSDNVTVSALDWTTPDAAFTLVNPPALPLMLVSGSMQTVTVRYAPTAPQADRGVVTVRSDDPGNPAIDVVATGNGFHPAQAPVYIDTGDSLYSYDPTSNTATLIAQFSGTSAQMTDIAIDSAGHLYGISQDGNVWSVDPVTAHSSMLFSVSDAAPVGLTCLSDGTLVVGGAALTIVDPRSGSVVRTLVPAGSYQTSGDVIALPDGMLYWSVTGGSADRIVRVDPNTGAMTAFPNLPTNNVYGLGYVSGQFLGFSGDGVAIQIDSTSGSQTLAQPLSGSWNGATTNPVKW